MQALKVLVIVMGALIVVGMGILAYGISVKFGEKIYGEAVASDGPGTVPATPWPDDLQIVVPAGARVAETVVAEGRMVVRLELSDGGSRFVVVDLVGGRRIGRVELAPDGVEP